MAIQHFKFLGGDGPTVRKDMDKKGMGREGGGRRGRTKNILSLRKEKNSLSC